jgi:phage tail-like protein
MTKTPAAQKNSYPLPVYNFRVTVDGQSVSFSEVSGIKLEYETVTYRHGLSCWEGETLLRYAYPKYVPISLKKGTVAGTGFFDGWLTGDKAARAMEISLCDEHGDSLVIWRIARAVPTRLDAPVFDAASNQVSVETLELMATGISVHQA